MPVMYFKVLLIPAARKKQYLQNSPNDDDWRMFPRLVSCRTCYWSVTLPWASRFFVQMYTFVVQWASGRL